MKKIVICTNSDSHFYAHLLPIALKAKQMGYEVVIATNIENHGSKIKDIGLKLIHIPIKRSNINPFFELILLARIILILFREKPDILHNFTVKPIIYCTIASVICQTPRVINNFLGMGTLFIRNSLVFKMLRMIVIKILSAIAYYKEVLFIVQNQDDRVLLESLGLNNVLSQCSVGVDTSRLKPLPFPPNGKIVFAFVGRMIVDKGVREFIEAARLLTAKKYNAAFWLVGSPDVGSLFSLTENELQNYDKEGYIKYLGYSSDIESIWKRAHVAVLPSYREGLSRSLLEAGACGRAIITTDAPGGRDLVQHMENGLLVPAQNSRSLADAMETLLNNNQLIEALGNKIRACIVDKYDSSVIAGIMTKYY